MRRHLLALVVLAALGGAGLALAPEAHAATVAAPRALATIETGSPSAITEVKFKKRTFGRSRFGARSTFRRGFVGRRSFVGRRGFDRRFFGRGINRNTVIVTPSLGGSVIKRKSFGRDRVVIDRRPVSPRVIIVK